MCWVWESLMMKKCELWWWWIQAKSYHRSVIFFCLSSSGVCLILSKCVEREGRVVNASW